MREPKILPPSMRPKYRYIVFEIISSEPVEYNDIITSIWNSALAFLGELESSKLNMWIIHNLFDAKTKRGVIKCDHRFVEQMRVILTLIQLIGESRVCFKILGVTGTVKSAINKYLGIRDLKSFS
jgi:ribonuclease P/MRP protein subunit POP5